MSIKITNRATSEIPVELLREILEFDLHTGEFRWKERPVEHFPNGKPSPEKRCAMWNGKYAGKPALTCVDPRGYKKGEVSGVFVWAHRAAWALVSGRWPTLEIDHINRNKGDNRFRNLRQVTHRDNAKNRAQGGYAGKLVAA
jgi:hypothetical protein